MLEEAAGVGVVVAGAAVGEAGFGVVLAAGVGDVPISVEIRWAGVAV